MIRSIKVCLGVGLVMVLNACGGSCGAGLGVVGAAACGSSSGSSEAARLSYDQMVLVGGRLIDENLTLTASEVDQIPVAGSASYSGVGAFSASSTDVLNNATSLAQVSLTANFADSSVSGQMSNFRAPDNDPYAGTLGISNGMIDRSATSGSPTISGDISGSLIEEQNVRYSYDGAFTASFFGDRQQTIYGEGSATRTGGGTSGTAYGAFLLEQD